MYTLNETWEHCIKMWQDLVKDLDTNNMQDGCENIDDYVSEFKGQWLEDHDLDDDINSNCFFCGYSDDWEGRYYCDQCPGRLVDPKFSCMNGRYSFKIMPRKFLAKLLELNEKRDSNDLVNT